MALELGPIEAHSEYLFNFAMGQVRDSYAAEDLVQETFLAALKTHERFEARCSERTWLVSILRHKIGDYFRGISRERSIRWFGALEVNYEQLSDRERLWPGESASDCQPPSYYTEQKEFRAVLAVALRMLPPRLALAFQLREIEDRSKLEICRQLRISENNLWVMIHRARRRLREHLGEWFH